MGKGRSPAELVKMLRDGVGRCLYREKAGSEGEDVGRVLLAIKQLILTAEPDVQVVI